MKAATDTDRIRLNSDIGAGQTEVRPEVPAVAGESTGSRNAHHEPAFSIVLITGMPGFPSPG